MSIIQISMEDLTLNALASPSLDRPLNSDDDALDSRFIAH